jgi:uncharacterized membrane-anchored protein
MIRILFFIVLALGCLGFGFAWLADRPGDMVRHLRRLPVSASR